MRFFIMGLILLAQARPVGATPPEGWELLNTDNNIEVARKTMPGSALFAFRGEADLALPIGVLVTTLLVDEYGPEWVDLMNKSVMVSEESPEIKVVHQEYDMPWPVSDRDFVMRQVSMFDEESRVYTLKFESVEDASMPIQDCCVRARAFRTFWRLQSQGNGTTHVEVEVFTDPKGYLPSWLVNLIQQDWPSNTIMGLERRAKVGDIPPDARTEGW